jgi:hypothetical protein
MPTNPPVFSMETTEITAISVFGTEKIPSAILTPNSRREKEYERMSIPPVTPSNQSIFNISKIETNELNRGFDMRDEEEIAENANEDSGFRLTRTRKY